MVPPRRVSIGRQRIAIRRIENEDARQVCFSKRRTGLFNKVSDLTTLCGAQVAAVVFSPAGKVFSFGHPSVESVLDRFISASPEAAAAVKAAMEAAAAARAREKEIKDKAKAKGGSGVQQVTSPGDEDESAMQVMTSPGEEESRLSLEELNIKCGELRAKLDMDKVCKERSDERLAAGRAENSRFAAWIEADVKQMTAEDLEDYRAVLMKVKADVKARADEVLRNALAGRPLPPLPLGGGSHSQLPGGGGFLDMRQLSGFEMNRGWANGGSQLGGEIGQSSGGGMQLIEQQMASLGAEDMDQDFGAAGFFQYPPPAAY